jgi:hypothetical protein
MGCPGYLRRQGRFSLRHLHPERRNIIDDHDDLIDFVHNDQHDLDSAVHNDHVDNAAELDKHHLDGTIVDHHYVDVADLILDDDHRSWRIYVYVNRDDLDNLAGTVDLHDQHRASDIDVINRAKHLIDNYRSRHEHPSTGATTDPVT